MWLADDEQAEMIERREKELLESGELEKQQKKKGGKRRKAENSASLDDMYHEGEQCNPLFVFLQTNSMQARVTSTMVQRVSLVQPHQLQQPPLPIVTAKARKAAREQSEPRQQSKGWRSRTV
jgi:hypothetical protein